MADHTMPKIIRHSKRLGFYVQIPAGWTARVPDVASANEALIKAYMDYFMSQGMSIVAAADAAHDTIQSTYAHGYIDGLKEAVARRLEEYVARFPELRNVVGRRAGLPIIEGIGFAPAVVQSAYVPFQRTGRAGQAFVNDLLAAMAASASKEEK